MWCNYLSLLIYLLLEPTSAWRRSQCRLPQVSMRHSVNDKDTTTMFHHKSSPSMVERPCITINRLLKIRVIASQILKMSKFRITGHLWEESSVTVGFHIRRISNAESVSVCWRPHVKNVWANTCTRVKKRWSLDLTKKWTYSWKWDNSLVSQLHDQMTI